MRAIEFVVEDYSWEQDPGMDFVNPLPVIDSADYFDLFDDVDGELIARSGQEPKSGPEYAKLITKMRNKFGTIEEVPIAQILATEKYLDPAVKHSKRAKPSSKLPILYKQGNKYIVGDGNHRIVRTYLKGKKTVKGLVLDADEILK